MAQYEYDAWGKHIHITDGSGNDVSDNPNHIANINPFRYRGYYFDVETGLYCVSSRYYDPEVGRWINADNAISSTGESVQGYNLFAYCFNNPVMRTDDNGDFWHIAVGGLLGGLIGGIAQVASNIIEGENAFDGVGAAFISGAASGALASTGVGIVGSIVGNAGISMIGNAATQVVENKGFDDFDVGDMLIDGAIGGISGAVGGAGYGSNHLKSASKQLTKRITNEMARHGVDTVIRETKKAVTYYVKSVGGMLKMGIIDGIIKPTVIGYAISTIY